MKTRRYILFLIVAVLTFFIGLGAALVVGGLNPFSSDSDDIHSVPPVKSEVPRKHACHDSARD
jgi:hypothetical protein